MRANDIELPEGNYLQAFYDDLLDEKWIAKSKSAHTERYPDWKVELFRAGMAAHRSRRQREPL